jgi:Xaa-Pro aminopeptidase
MSKDDFPAEEFAERQRRVRAKMAAVPLEDGPLTVLMRLAEVPEVSDHSLAEDVRGWGGREPEDPVEAFAAIMRNKGYLNRRVGLEVPDFYMHPYSYLRIKDLLGEALVQDSSLLVHDLKLVKSPAELAYIRQASAIADAAMETAETTISEGASEMEVAGEVYHTLLSLGGDVPASPINFVTGERTCYAHGAPSPRRIRPGDFMHIEYGAAVKRYCTTIGRHFCLGEPTPRMRELHQVVREACDACIAEVRAGVPAVTPHLAAKKVIADAGLDRYRLHTTGYGIAPGYPPSWGEYIHFFADSSYTLEAGMVLSVEPPVMIHEEKLGARLIDDVLVTETGAEILSSFTRDLVVIEA